MSVAHSPRPVRLNPRMVDNDGDDNATNDVWLADVRSSTSYEVSGPSEDSTPEAYVLWNLLQNLIGDDPYRRIKKLVVFAHPSPLSCRCGAFRDEDSPSKACGCPEGTAIVSFDSPMAAANLKQAIKAHRETHEDGVIPGSLKDQRVEMCDKCCYNFKKFRVTTILPKPIPPPALPAPQIFEEEDPAIQDVDPDNPVLVDLEPGDHDDLLGEDDADGEAGEQDGQETMAEEQAAGEEPDTESNMVNTNVENAVTLAFVGIMGVPAATKADIVSLQCRDETMEDCKGILMDAVKDYLESANPEDLPDKGAQITEDFVGAWTAIQTAYDLEQDCAAEIVAFIDGITERREEREVIPPEPVAADEVLDAVRAGALFAGMLGILEGKPASISLEVKKECNGKTLKEAKAIYERKSEGYVRDKMPGAPGEVYEALVALWKTVAEGGDDCLVKANSIVSEAKRQRRLRQKANTTPKGGTADDGVKGGGAVSDTPDHRRAGSRPADPGDTGTPKLVHTPKPTEASCRRMVKRLEDAIEVNSVTEIMKISNLTTLKERKEETARHFHDALRLFESPVISDKLEEEYEDRLTQAKTAYRGIQDAFNQKMELEDRRASVAGVTRLPGSKSEEHPPSADEINMAINMAASYVTQMIELEQEAAKVLEDENVGQKKMQVLAIKDSVDPAARVTLTDFEKLANQAKTWSRLAVPGGAAVKMKLEAIVKDYWDHKANWQRVRLDLSRIDGQHGFSMKTHDSVAGKLLQDQKIDTYYNEPGKKYQNLIEWLKRLETRKLQYFTQESTKVDLTISRLSPKIAIIANANHEKFKTYAALKNWLIDTYLEEEKTLAEWQKEIATVKVEKEKDVSMYVTHVQGILREIKECAQGRERLVKKLFSAQNMTLLTKAVLAPLSKVTHKDRHREFLEEDWHPYAAERRAADKDPDPEMMFKLMGERLEKIKSVSRECVQFEKEASLAEPPIPLGQSKASKRFLQLYQKAQQDGSEDPFDAATEKYTKEIHTTKPDTPKNQPKKGGKKSVLALQGTGDNRGIWTIIGTASAKPKTIPKDHVLVNQESLDRAKKWEDKKLVQRCWVCDDAKPHEFSSCTTALAATNKVRMAAARDPKKGPGVQCFSCLKGTCFAERCLAAPPKDGAKMALKPCKQSDDRTHCTACIEVLYNWDPKTAKGKIKPSPIHAAICVFPDHARISERDGVLGKMEDVYGSDITELQISIHQYPAKTMPQEKVTESLNNTEMINKSTPRKVKDKKVKFEEDDWNKADTKFPDVYRVPESEYKGAEVSQMFDGKEGSVAEFDAEKNKDQIIREQPGTPLFFMQVLNLGGAETLCFYDSGAMMHLIETATARRLNLKMVRREGLYIVGAGNKLSMTRDGKYELVLGKAKNGKIIVIEADGMEELTGRMVKMSFASVHSEVRDEARRLANSGQPSIDPDQPLPASVGGSSCKIIFGMRTPRLQPKIRMHLPGGLLVGDAEITDVWGSNVTFGGVHENPEEFYKVSYFQQAGVTDVEKLRQFNFQCHGQYVQFRDSVRQDAVFLNDRVKNHGNVEMWNSILETETDEQAKLSPCIIAGSEEKRSIQIQRREALNELIRDGEEYLLRNANQLPSNDRTEVEEGKVEVQTAIVVDGATLPDDADMLYSNVEWRQQDRRSLEINNAVEEVCGKFYNTGLVGDTYEEESFGDEILFETEEDRIADYKTLRPEPYLQELILKETGLTTSESTWEQVSLGLRGRAAFEAELPPGCASKEAPAVHTCRDCKCAMKDVDKVLDEVQSYGTNVDARGIYKLKQALRKWEDEDATGTGVDYRCSRCAGCKECVKSGKIRARSMREEDEQVVIEASVRIDWEQQVCYVYLPWIKSPAELAIRWGSDSNIKQASHFLKKMLQRSDKDRESLVLFWEELKKRDVVCRLKDLPTSTQEKIASSPIKHFYPWNAVWKDSPSTPCRMVMDSRCSGLNEHLAKGHNTLNNLQMLLIKFRAYRHAGSYDISKMYNMLRIEESHLCYQMILWVDQMDPNREVEVWVIQRAIYGTVSSGNQAEVAIRRGANALSNRYPEGAYTIIYETYVDDGLPTRDDPNRLIQALQEVSQILDAIGFSLKCTIISGQTGKLPSQASSDGVTVGIGGYNYTPEGDTIGLSPKECNFNKNLRGAKKPNKHKVVTGEDIDDDIMPPTITRAEAVGKVAEVFDLLGMFMTLIVEGKILAREIAHLDWKDIVPPEYMEKWKKFVQKVQDARALKIDRCTIPENAITKHKIDIFEIHDASKHCAAACIYVRTALPDGQFSTRLLFSRSALCPPTQVIPRNELASAHIGGVTIFICRVALGEKVDRVYSFGDSRVTLYWICNPNLKLKAWVFARVSEIRRISGTVEYYWVRGEWNIADIATKGRVTIYDLTRNSAWHLGEAWMHMSMEDLIENEYILDFDKAMGRLTKEELKELDKEHHPALPDLVTGDRKDAKPDLDIDVMQCTDPAFLGERRPGEGIPQMKHVRHLLGLQSINVQTAETHPGSSCLSLITEDLPLDDRHTLVAQSSANFFPVAGRRRGRVTNLGICEILTDPTPLGWRLTFNTVVFVIKSTWQFAHNAHQDPTSGHHLYGKLSEESLTVRRGLKRLCKICNKIRVNPAGTNLAYTDAIRTGVKNVDKLDQLVRVDKSGSALKRDPVRCASKEVTDSQTFVVEVQVHREDIEEHVSKEALKARTVEEEAMIDDSASSEAWKLFTRQMSKEVTQSLSPKDKKMIQFDEEEKIWKYFGRLLERTSIETRDIELNEFIDSDKIVFVQPVGLASSPLVRSIVMDLHWNIHPHKGNHSTNRVLAQVLHVIKGGNLVRSIREKCHHCRRILKRVMKERMGDVPIEKLLISPAFYASQIDTAGPFKAYSRHNFRSVIEVNALIITCINTSAVSIVALETLEAPSIVKGILRHSNRYGFPYIAYIDLGTGLVKASKVKMDLTAHTTILRKACGMRVVAKPTQAHPSRGKVERVAKVLKTGLENEKLFSKTQSVLDWETTFSMISNYINNLPMARLSNNRSLTNDIHEVLTPNRLLLGRNNERSPTYVHESEGVGYENRLLQNSRINQAWFSMLLKLTADLVYRPKWHEDSKCLPVCGDVVLFLHKESRVGREHEIWKQGIIASIEDSKSSNTKIYEIEYRTCIKRKGQKIQDAKVETMTTTRTLREIVMLYSVEEINSERGSREHVARLCGERISDQE